MLARSTAAALPTTAPIADGIVQIDLEDPLTPQSRCYVDLDTGSVFSRGALASGDVMQSSAWIRKNGIDLMCESREPANGLVAYDMAILPTDATVDHPPAFATVRLQFAHVESQPFDFLSPTGGQSKTYLVRTADGMFGILEMLAKAQNPSGWKVRFSAVRQPPLNLPGVDVPGAGAVAAGPEMALQMAKTQMQLQLRRYESVYGPRHPSVRKLQAQIDATGRQIKDLQFQRRKQALQAATQPAKVAPVTQPVE